MSDNKLINIYTELCDTDIPRAEKVQTIIILLRLLRKDITGEIEKYSKSLTTQDVKSMEYLLDLMVLALRGCELDGTTLSKPELEVQVQPDYKSGYKGFVVQNSERMSKVYEDAETNEASNSAPKEDHRSIEEYEYHGLTLKDLDEVNNDDQGSISYGIGTLPKIIKFGDLTIVRDVDENEWNQKESSYISGQKDEKSEIVY